MAKFINNSIDNTIGGSNSGLTNTFTVENTSNTGSSAARETITVGGSTADDPTLNFNVSGVTDWEMGIDNSVSDNLTISQSTALGTKDVWRMNVSGQRTMPLQPFFKAYPSAQNNVTGDGTLYVVQFTNIVSNIGSCFDGTSTFTAPVTGVYWFSFSFQISGINVAHTRGSFAMNLTSGATTLVECNPENVSNDLGNMTVNTYITLPMTTGDIAQAEFIVSPGAKTVSVSGITTSFFTGGLLF